MIRDQLNGRLDYAAMVDEGIRLGIFHLKDVPEASRKQWASEISQVARSLKDKSGCPAVIPVKENPGQGVLLNVAKTEDRFLNLVRRGIQCFGHHMRWKASARDMEERGEETLPVAEFKDGWAEVLAEYRLQAARLAEECRDGEVGEDTDSQEDVDEDELHP